MLKVFEGDTAALKVDEIVNITDSRLWKDAGAAGSLTSINKARQVTQDALQRAEGLKLETLAFFVPKFGVGEIAALQLAKVMVSEVRRYLAGGSCLKEVTFTALEQKVCKYFAEIVDRDKVICLGDSITYGYPYGPEKSWVKISAEQLDRCLINKGINGDTTAQMAVRFQSDVVDLKPSFVIILGGANDALLGMKLARTQKAVSTMIAQAFDEGICPIVGLPAAVSSEGILSDFPPEEETAKDLRAIREWLKSYAAEKAIPVIDFYSPLLDSSGLSGDSKYYVDGYHPNLTGYQVLAEDVVVALSNLKVLL